ncbi:MAG: AMP-binding protein [Candidatus Hodarchaeales archaeon]|jgi:acyl-coenzyme A synthetase/AMP-(fatty) acid ligase
MQFGISESINHWAKYRKDKVAIYSNGNSITYNQFNSKINKLSKKIDEINPTTKRIGLALKSKIDLIVSIISVIRTGKSVVLLNVNLPDDPLKTNLVDTKLELLIHDNDFIKIKELCSDSNIESLNIHNYLNKEDKDIKYNSQDCKPDNEWGILFSSGTTGSPKGIERHHNSMVTEFLGWCLELNLSKRTVFYIGRPIYYTGGLVLALSTFIVGGSIVINDSKNDNDFDLILDDYKNTLENIEIEWAFFVPDQIKHFCSKVEEKKIKVKKNTENILIMGSPISGSEKTKANQILQANIIESWGNTESLGTITEADDLFVRPNSIGRPFITDELFIVDDNLKKLPPNSIGQIAGNEEAGFSKYSNKPTETERIKQKELIISDDYGYTDDDGYFYIKGREQEKIINNKGEIHWTFEIEEKIVNLPSINNCCIVFKGTHSGEGLCVAITVNNNIDKSSVIGNVSDLLNEYEMTFNSIKIVDNLPKLTSGKVDKISLVAVFNE